METLFYIRNTDRKYISAKLNTEDDCFAKDYSGRKNLRSGATI
jgi:hypothetical protein